MHESIKDTGFACRAQNPEEEFVFVINLLGEAGFFEQNNYSVVLPHDQEFWQIVDDKQEFSDNTLRELKRIFIKQEYDAHFYELGLINAKKGIPIYQNALIQLHKLTSHWDFFIPSQYQILLTKYGPGGSYDHNSGTIVIRTNKNGTFYAGAIEPEYTVLHEMVHIGIERGIVEKYQLSHAEKETVVDALCSIHLKDYFPDYELQNLNQGDLLDLLDIESFFNLPSVISEHKG